MKITPIYKIVICSLAFLEFASCSNPDNDSKKIPLDSAENNKALLNLNGPALLNMMRIEDGAFRKKTIDGVPGSDRNDLKNTINYLTSNDSNIVIYAHGGLIPRVMAYTSPIKRGYDTTFRKGICFPYYILYGGGPADALWLAGKGIFSADDKEDSLELQNEKQSKFDSAINVMYNRKSVLYVLSKVHKYFYDRGVGFALFSQPYKPIRDTTLGHLKDVWQQESQREDITGVLNLTRTNTPTADEDSAFIKSMVNDTILQNLARQDISQEQLLRVNSNAVNPVLVIYDLARMINNTVKRYNNGRAHGLVNTIVEELLRYSSNTYVSVVNTLAERGWSAIKNCTEQAFNPDGSNYGGTALLDELLRLDRADSARGKHRKIYLIGSSTGTILICNALIKANDPKYKRLSFNIIFSVPACTFELLDNVLMKSKDKIKSFFIFALNNNNELHAGWEFLYPGTILYFVSGVCEDDNYLDKPIVGMQRYYSDEYETNTTLSSIDRRAIKNVRAYFKGKPIDRYGFVWSNQENDNPNLSNTGDRHTRVIKNPAVQKSIIFILKNY